jgi:Anti-sigma factor NepR
MTFHTDPSLSRSDSNSSSSMSLSAEDPTSENASTEAASDESRLTATAPINAQWITDQLRIMFDNVASEPLPEQFVILFRHLNEVEGISKAR